MNFFNRLPGFTQTPSGKERLVLRRLPWILLFGTFLLALPSLASRLIFDQEDSLAISTTDIYVISLIILHWTVVLTVGIAAFVVMVMKGPAYVADAYPMQDADTLNAPPKWKPRGH
jgi:hypothetical protein